MRRPAICFLVVASAIQLSFKSHAAAQFPQQQDSGHSFVSAAASSPQQNFEHAYQLAQQGDCESGLTLAQQTLDTYPDDLNTKLAFIESMVKMQKLPGETLDVKFLNCAIRVANELKGVVQCNGSQDPALGFNYLRALGELAYAVEPKQEKVSVQLKYAIGTVAENLRHNPRVTPDTHKYLATPYYDKARAHAALGETQLAAKSLNQAFELGFSDFERAANEKVFSELENADDIRDIIRQRTDSIVDEEQLWAEKSLAEFETFSFVIDVDGLLEGRISNADFDGKILVVDLWATWCPPCVKEIPHFIQLQNEFRDKNVAVLGIAMDDVDDPIGARAAVKDKVTELQVNYPVGLGSKSTANQIAGEMSLPTTLFIDSSGNVRFMTQGYLKYSQLEAITKELVHRDHRSQ
jgi:thiol-disulfide isomerase/thioredoxin